MRVNSAKGRPQGNFSFVFNDTATTEIYTLSLPDALPISLNGYTISLFIFHLPTVVEQPVVQTVVQPVPVPVGVGVGVGGFGFPVGVGGFSRFSTIGFG